MQKGLREFLEMLKERQMIEYKKGVHPYKAISELTF